MKVVTEAGVQVAWFSIEPEELEGFGVSYSPSQQGVYLAQTFTVEGQDTCWSVESLEAQFVAETVGLTASENEVIDAGEQITISALGSSSLGSNLVYEWTGPEMDCTDCTNSGSLRNNHIRSHCCDGKSMY